MIHLVTNWMLKSSQKSLRLVPMKGGGLEFGWMKLTLFQTLLSALRPIGLMALLVCAPGYSYAQSTLVIPSVRGSSAADEIQTSSGIRCRQSVDGGMSLDTGVSATIEGDAATYIRLTVPIGAPKRLDCHRLYELEVQKLQAEIDSLRGNDGINYTVD